MCVWHSVAIETCAKMLGLVHVGCFFSLSWNYCRMNCSACTQLCPKQTHRRENQNVQIDAHQATGQNMANETAKNQHHLLRMIILFLFSKKKKKRRWCDDDGRWPTSTLQVLLVCIYPHATQQLHSFTLTSTSMRIGFPIQCIYTLEQSRVERFDLCTHTHISLKHLTWKKRSKSIIDYDYLSLLGWLFDGQHLHFSCIHLTSHPFPIVCACKPGRVPADSIKNPHSKSRRNIDKRKIYGLPLLLATKQQWKQ